MKREIHDKRNLALDAEARVGPALRAYKASPSGKNMKTLKNALRGWEAALRAWRRAQELTGIPGRPATGRLLVQSR